jgi:hypothetical protein
MPKRLAPHLPSESGPKTEKRPCRAVDGRRAPRTRVQRLGALERDEGVKEFEDSSDYVAQSLEQTVFDKQHG